MTKRFKVFVEKTVQQIEGNQQEKDDLFEELIIHLELSKEQLIQEGLSEKDAEKRAMEHFGNEAEIGHQIQQAMFPYRKEMLCLLGISSLLFSIAIYLAQLFLEGDAYILWLVLAVMSGTFLIVFSIQSIAFLNRRLWMNSLILIHSAIYLFGGLLTTGIAVPSISIPLSIFWFCIIILAIILIYRTTIHDYKSSNHPLPKHARMLHIINITAGVAVIGIVLFFLWGVLVMIGQLSPVMMFVLLPLIVWIGLYIVQMHLIRLRKMVAAYAVACVPISITIVVLGLVIIEL